MERDKLSIHDLFGVKSLLRSVLGDFALSVTFVKMWHVDVQGNMTKLYYPSWQIGIEREGGLLREEPPLSLWAYIATNRHTQVDFAANFIGDFYATEEGGTYAMYFFDGPVDGAAKLGSKIYALVDGMGVVTFSVDSH